MKTKTTNTLGWESWHTGGGCMAWGFNLSGADNPHTMATEHDGHANIPAEGAEVLVGYYDDAEISDGIYIVVPWAEFITATPAEWGARAKAQGAYAFPPPTYQAADA